MIAAAVAAALVAASAGAAPAEERFAVLAGRNDGGPGRTQLRFAEADAARFADTLVELGGFPRGQVRLLRAPGREELLRGIGEAGAAGRAAKAKGAGRALLLVYFSGHAGDDGLELGGELVRFEELKAALDASPADVRIAFVDACRAGALTRAKGARAVAEEFEVTVASDASPDGTAIIASTAAGEDALESAELRGSFFTHHLSAGLRGAADADADGRISLGEAYGYAYAHTVEQTTRAAGVAQHPTFELSLRGKGELILAELSRADGALSLPGDPTHRWLVVGESRPVVYEVRPARGVDKLLALPAGRYRLVRATAGEVLSGGFELRQGDRLRATDVPLASAPYAAVIRKGLADRDAHAVTAQLGLGTSFLKNFGAAQTVGLGTRHDFTDRLGLLLRGTYGWKSVNDEGFRYDYRSYGGHAIGAFRFPLVGFEAWAGPLLGGAGVVQRLANGEEAGTFDLQAGAATGLSLPLSGPLAAHVALELVGHRFVLNEAPAFRATAAGTFGLEYSVLP